MPDNTPQGKPRSVIGSLVAIALVLVAGFFGWDLTSTDDNAQVVQASSTQASISTTSTTAGLDTCSMDQLPQEAAKTVSDILAGGPFPFPNNDNTRFGNYEGKLPQEDRDFYREYTVVTPGLSHRGPRRIVTGGGTMHDPQVWFYTDDHYESFCEIPDAES